MKLGITVMLLICACTDGTMGIGRFTPPRDTSSGPQDTASEPDTVDTNAAETDTESSLEADAGEPCDAGVSFMDICWFLGDPGQSCLEVCAPLGAYDDAATAVIGTRNQNGTPTNCEDIIRLLGYQDNVAPGYRTDDMGLGCHIWDSEEIWWLYDPDFDPEASLPEARIVCGCLLDS